MPIAEDVQMIIGALDQQLPALETMSGPEARKRAKEVLVPWDDAEPVDEVQERDVPGPAGAIPVRIYRPQAEGVLPALVFFHGGGWVICDLDTHDALCRSIANRVPCVVVSVDYRLAPENKFPAAAEDAYAATAWVAEHSGELRADPARIAVGGDSAGGNLTAVTALMARDRGGPPLAFQMMVYPVTNHAFDTASYRDNGEGYFLTRPGMEWFWSQYLAKDADGENPYASPLRAADLKGLPPALIVTAEYDPLRDEGEAYGRRLQEAGVQAEIRRYPGMIHGFFSMGTVLEGARVANREAFAILGKALGQKEAAR